MSRSPHCLEMLQRMALLMLALMPVLMLPLMQGLKPTPQLAVGILHFVDFLRVALSLRACRFAQPRCRRTPLTA